jgi:hypothetical protein
VTSLGYNPTRRTYVATDKRAGRFAETRLLGLVLLPLAAFTRQPVLEAMPMESAPRARTGTRASSPRL